MTGHLRFSFLLLLLAARLFLLALAMTNVLDYRFVLESIATLACENQRDDAGFDSPSIFDWIVCR
jgi:hypothetical protein